MPGAAISGFYDTTDPAKNDTENSLFTNLGTIKPKGFTALRFERGCGTPPASPVPVDISAGHLHYYRYQLGGPWTHWEEDQTVVKWNRVARRLPDDGSAGPSWLALRRASAEGSIRVENAESIAGKNFGIRMTIHASAFGPTDAIACCEQHIDGVIAACHADRYSAELLTALKRKFPGLPEEELHRAMNNPVGPVFPVSAIKTKRIQFTPDDDRCIIGELTLLSRDSSSKKWPELSGEIFSVRRRTRATTD